MSAKLKLYVGIKVHQSLRKQTHITPEKLKSLLRIGGVENSGNDKANLHIPLDTLQRQLGIPNANDILNMKPDSIISNIYTSNNRANRKIVFEINKQTFIKDILENINKPDLVTEKKKIIVEFSSPNIAKPFHVGHLRSTIIGNFIANLNKHLGHEVIRLNYLGDWGTQFGFLQLGVNMGKITNDQIKIDPIQTLYKAYVDANKLAETNPNISQQARDIFKKMEEGEGQNLENLNTFKKYTLDELNVLYKRLGVTFDEYNFESMYSAKDIQDVVAKLEKAKIIHKDTDGRKIAVIQDKKIPLIKSDGSMLYITRDIAAALDRYKKYKFDQMLYVVDNSQSDHFNALHDVLFRMDLPWAGRIKHVKFGRIRGMSTRKGKAVFLKDILNEAKELMKKNQIKSPTTKASITDERTSDILGISCVIVNDLKQRRQKDYSFDWSKILQEKGDTGVRLQYTHCRLTSLQKTTQVPATLVCIPEFLKELEAMKLVIHLAQFNEVLLLCHKEMEASALVVYLFHLCNYISKALSTLRVKDQEFELASQRMLLFTMSKEVLRQGMEILGMQPLNEM